MLKRIVLIEDSLETLNYLIDKINLMQNFKCECSFRDMESFLANYKHFNFDLILLDLGLPFVENGYENIRLLKHKFPNIDIVIITVHSDEQVIIKSITLGASGYLLKSEAVENLENELQVVLSGGSAISPLIARRLVTYFNERSKVVHKILTLKEQQVLKLMADGKTYEEIGTTLAVKLDTVRYYIRCIYKKLHVNNRSSAIQKYFMQYFK